MYKERIETCAQRIRAALRIREMKQIDLCNLAKVPQSSLSLYLSGAYEPRQDRLAEMAQVLNVSEAWLMGYDVPMERGTVETPEPKVVALSEYEQLMIDLLRRVPEDKQKMVIDVIQTVLDAYK